MHFWRIYVIGLSRNVFLSVNKRGKMQSNVLPTDIYYILKICGTYCTVSLPHSKLSPLIFLTPIPIYLTIELIQDVNKC